MFVHCLGHAWLKRWFFFTLLDLSACLSKIKCFNCIYISLYSHYMTSVSFAWYWAALLSLLLYWQCYAYKQWHAAKPNSHIAYIQRKQWMVMWQTQVCLNICIDTQTHPQDMIQNSDVLPIHVILGCIRRCILHRDYLYS